jgi:predicted GIY-YIG superfamily endonuclease
VKPALQSRATVRAPAERPLGGLRSAALHAALARALAQADGAAGAHAIHELWMRGEMSLMIERTLAALWAVAAESIPDWLPMRYVERLPEIYEIALRFGRVAKGRSNIYLVLLDYADSRSGPIGLYVGMSHYSPAQRFDQHKAGIRAAGSVLRRGLEVLTGPTLHLQYMRRSEAARTEEEFAEVLRAAGFLVQGGH